MDLDWTPRLERGYLAAVLENKLGSNPEVLPPDLFSQELEPVARVCREFRDKHGLWPTRTLLIDIVEDEDLAAAKDVKTADKTVRAYAEKIGRAALKRQAVKSALLDSALVLDDPEEAWESIPTRLKKALAVGSKKPEAYQYLDRVTERHKDEPVSMGLWRAPTGCAKLDAAMRGGLGPGELGAIIGPTKAGKSQVAVAFAYETLKAGGDVIYFTFELNEGLLARRFDRAISEMTHEEISKDPALMQKKVKDFMGERNRLHIVWGRRRSVTTGMLHDMLDEKLQEVGKKCLVVVDYGAIMRPAANLKKYEALDRIHEELGSMMQEFRVPCWTPFQANREGTLNAADALDVGHVAGSFDATAHFDVLMTMNMTKASKKRGCFRLNLAGMRDGQEVEEQVTYDWFRSRLNLEEEDDD